ncbi:52 kDa repressor of the inhibitor of the protein kinase-like [Corticium candelabrum]|uniref:52 kDa repressor of the inhibitor of the protein kinase-like n=1 Tax=Corticium candelabrum TaxID=121492 RepID=UPI002E265CB5|nr:52 kDa repressor of the inhibitor of the protein kinase-like [Corticium candelabrum]
MAEPPKKKRKQLSIQLALGKKLESSDGSEATSYARSPFNEANGDAKENLHQDQEVHPTDTEMAQSSFKDPTYYIHRRISDDERLYLLKNKWIPPLLFKFPTRNGRKYNCRWEEDYSWLRYSSSKDAAFCSFCVLFAEQSTATQTTARCGFNAGSFHSSGFHDWKNATGLKRSAIRSHECSEMHKNSAAKARSLLNVAEGKSKDIQSSISTSHEVAIQKNRAIILSVIDLVIALGQRNVPFRGHNWDKQQRREDGNFDFFLNWKSTFDPVLQEHLLHGKKNAVYRSPDVQNEIIQLAGLEVRKKIVNDAKVSKWFSVMADECTDAAQLEQMAICIRFVDETSYKKFEVREEFIGFVELAVANAECISAAITDYLKECDLDIGLLRGQGYDGASVMSGRASGVSTRILQQQPRAFYQHCRSHKLNLVIASSCKQVPQIRDMFDSVGALTWFLGGSPKRKSILSRYLKIDDISEYLTAEFDEENVTTAEPQLSDVLVQKSAKKQLPVLCQTRWSARLATLSSMLAKYKAICHALEDIAIESSSSDSRTQATSYSRLLHSSQFIVSLVVAQFILSFCDPLTMVLQKPNCDVLKAFRKAKLLRSTIAAQRNEQQFGQVWRKAKAIAEELQTEIRMPRMTARSKHRSNAGVGTLESECPEAYFRRNVFYTFIDHTVTQLEERFPNSSEGMFLGFSLLPNFVLDLTTDDKEAITRFFSPDLPKPETFDTEILIWKSECSEVPRAERLNATLLDTLQLADKDFYPNVHAILKLLLTLPVGRNILCEWYSAIVFADARVSVLVSVQDARKTLCQRRM